MRTTLENNLADLVDQWLAHCEDCVKSGDKRHKPLSEGGTATYDRSLSWTLVVCRVARCKWQALYKEEQGR